MLGRVAPRAGPADGPRRLWWPLVLAGLLLVAADAIVRLLTPAPQRPERAALARAPPATTRAASGGEDARVDERAG